jgi:hypothetical protein
MDDRVFADLSVEPVDLDPIATPMEGTVFADLTVEPVYFEPIDTAMEGTAEIPDGQDAIKMDRRTLTRKRVRREAWWVRKRW